MEDISIIKRDGEYLIVKKNKWYVVFKGDEILKTPAGKIAITLYLPVAELLLRDWKEQGYGSYTSPTSLLSFHFTMMDHFAKMPKQDILDMLNSMNWEKSWTLKGCPSGNPDLLMKWMAYFGGGELRIEQIRQWLQNQTIMQLAASVCIYNAFMDFNVPFCWAYFIECVSKEEHKIAIDDFYDFYCHFDNEFDYASFYTIFERFRLYYGIHFKEDGRHIPVPEGEPEGEPEGKGMKEE